MKAIVARSLLVTLMGASVFGCGGYEQPHEKVAVYRSNGSTSFAARKVEALRLTRQGKLLDAVNQWKVLDAIDPDDRQVSSMLQSVQSKIKRKASTHFERAEAAMAKRRFKAARLEYLKVLVYDPQHRRAIRKLRNFEIVRNRRSRPRAYDPYLKPKTN